MKISQLCFDTPLGYFIKKDLCDYINISKFKRIQCSFFSDVNVELTFIFSYNGERECAKLRYSSGKVNWKNISLDCIFPYLKINVENKEDLNSSESKDFILLCDGHIKRGEIGEVEHQPSIPVSRSPPSLELPSTSPSPKRKWLKFSSPKSESSESSGKVSSQLPELILPNTLFVGDKYNKIKTISPGVPGQVLMYTNDGVKWCDPTF